MQTAEMDTERRWLSSSSVARQREVWRGKTGEGRALCADAVGRAAKWKAFARVTDRDSVRDRDVVESCLGDPQCSADCDAKSYSILK